MRTRRQRRVNAEEIERFYSRTATCENDDLDATELAATMTTNSGGISSARAKEGL